ncbi:UvrD-helicase domain-containing protein [Glutamicibacter sp. AOP5-A2-18]|uniref:UvrD-helicase domain-containing protein n=1 Tax=Glutamicibacter sp. AOP5-A2-18 TaxID=3457656 RepID=UPI004034E418
MSTYREPTLRQKEIRDAPELGLLITAPAGCGKTEALALRIKGLIDHGRVLHPRRILVLTFTNRAKDNIQERMRDYLEAHTIRNHVTVHNFHGLSARIIRSHGNLVGLDDEWHLPTSDWIGMEARERGLSWRQASFVRSNLQKAKQDTVCDEEVLSRLAKLEHPLTLGIEQKLIVEKILTYDDLPRLADLILETDQVSELYKEHFCAVIVDEFQDLTPQQLRIVQHIGRGRTTYAGDLAQGIYSFTGADPEGILSEIEKEVQGVITFAESHRSSPAVLGMVNAMVPWTGGIELKPAPGKTWPGGGLASHLEFDRETSEAEWVIAFSRSVLARGEKQRIGVLSRTKKRREELDAKLEESEGISWYRWDDPIFDSATAPIIRGVLNRINVTKFFAADAPTSYLNSLVNINEPFDPATLELVQAGVEWIADLLRDGMTVDGIRQRVRFGDGDTLLTVPGIHLLTGHAGKGQQFDWVIILGLEEGSIPAFQAKSPEAITEEARVLAVMLSRARHGVLTTRTRLAVKPWGEETATPSRFLQYLEQSPHHVSWAAAKEWLNHTDWKSIADTTS